MIARAIVPSQLGRRAVDDGPVSIESEAVNAISRRGVRDQSNVARRLCRASTRRNGNVHRYALSGGNSSQRRQGQARRGRCKGRDGGIPVIYQVVRIY